MSQFALRMPDSLHHDAKKIANSNNTSLNQFIVTAVAEKISALRTEEFFRQRVKKANLNDFDAILTAVPSRTQMAGDEL